MNNRPVLFSLVLTAHRKDYLMEALISVCAQTDQDFEFVLCLDLHEDSQLADYCTSLFEQISCRQKKLITVIGNGTAGFCRNEAFRNTTGRWISYLDGDDMIAPVAVERMKHRIQRDKHFDIFSSGMMRIDANGVCIGLPDSLTYYPPREIYWIDSETIGVATFFNQFQAMRREVWEQYNYDESSNGEDIDFMLINLLKWNFRKVPEYLYYYRDVDNSFSKKIYAEGDFTTKRYQDRYYLRYYEENYSDFFFCNFV